MRIRIRPTGKFCVLKSFFISNHYSIAQNKLQILFLLCAVSYAIIGEQYWIFSANVLDLDPLESVSFYRIWILIQIHLLLNWYRLAIMKYPQHYYQLSAFPLLTSSIQATFLIFLTRWDDLFTRWRTSAIPWRGPAPWRRRIWTILVLL